MQFSRLFVVKAVKRPGDLAKIVAVAQKFEITPTKCGPDLGVAWPRIGRCSEHGFRRSSTQSHLIERAAKQRFPNFLRNPHPLLLKPLR